jgi:hypothetical protein
VLVFLSGALVGAFAYRLYMVRTVSSGSMAKNPEEYRKRAIEEMTTRLRLSAEQVSSVQQIYDDTRRRFRELHEKQRPDYRVIENDQYQRILALLTDPQRVEYQKMREERDRRRQQQGPKGKSR